MVGYIEKSTGDFTPTPEGAHLMICSRVVDIGTQTSTGMYGTKSNRKIVISWEIPEHRVEIDGKDLPLMHTETYTWSMHEKANLRKMLESWRGKKFVENDFTGPPNGFNIKSLIGAPCRGQIVHDSTSGTTYANLATVMSAGFKSKEDWPALEGEPLFFDLDAFDQPTFDRLSQHWQSKIIESPEYSGGGQSNDTGQPSGGAPAGNNAPDDDFDHIPF